MTRRWNRGAGSPPAFVEIPGDFLRSIATDNERIPQLYFCGNTLSSRIFWLRLRWIHALLVRHVPSRGSVLDFGGGGGVFLPSLARLFDRVVSIDLETREAERVVDRYGLANVELVRADVATAELAAAPFDAIVAADVLEHFRDLGLPVAALWRWLAPDGRLFTSLPTESGTYDRLRRLYGVPRPPDHYHTGWEVEAYLETAGFRRLARRFVPLVVRIAPLYLVTAWSRSTEEVGA
jgi:SAM-dependent methyltransferase